MAAMMYRQGDLLLIRVNTLPDGARQRSGPGDRLILAHGEATGHHHSVAAADAELTVTDADEAYLRVMRPTSLEHQEHRVIELEPGTYWVVRQREYGPRAFPEGSALLT
jgi:hypothetical protein